MPVGVLQSPAAESSEVEELFEIIKETSKSHVLTFNYGGF